jgi:hypothetical protein
MQTEAKQCKTGVKPYSKVIEKGTEMVKNFRHRLTLTILDTDWARTKKKLSAGCRRSGEQANSGAGEQ